MSRGDDEWGSETYFVVELGGGLGKLDLVVFGGFHVEGLRHVRTYRTDPCSREP